MTGEPRVSDRHPTGSEWRADALAGSRHSRLLDELRLPRAEIDPTEASRLCGEVCRGALRDLAPVVILVPASERRRVQALAAYILVLFDFARQSGLEGERLAQINRWQFQVEEALDGETAGQPIFLCLQLEEARRPWDREALDGIADAARRRVAVRRPPTAESRAAELERLTGALTLALLGGSASARDLATGLLRLFSLLDLGEGLRRHDSRLPSSELPDEWHPGGDGDAGLLLAAIERQAALADPLLDPAQLVDIPPDWRSATRFLALAGRRLLRQVRKAGASVIEQPPRLGLATRIGLLLRARWL